MPSSVKLEGGDASPGAGTRFALEQEGWTESIADLLARAETATEEPVHAVASADELLMCGIGDYTYIRGPDGILGRGKFSTVYKVIGPTGEEYALKHTPLYPHHPLIAARLLREPTLLAQIPPHPYLVGVEGWVKSCSHFYLVETLSRDHVPLSEVRTPISRRAAKKVLDQLVSVVRDGLHRGGRVCHRDLKGENVLIDGKGNLILLDLGLATHFSLSEPRLTTCCGSPAFHSPEIVDALNQPPGAVSYYGPELDIWCIALTVLSLLINRRYPIGTTHRCLEVMAQAVTECLHELDSLYPLSFGDPSSKYREEDEAEWKSVRYSLEAFLQIDGDARMRAFDEYVIGEGMDEAVRKHRIAVQGKAFKSVSFEKAEIKYTLPVTLKPIHRGEDPPNHLLLCNPEEIPRYKIMSYLKYLLRSAGILYHTLSKPDESTSVLQCVLTLSPDSPHIPHKRPVAVSNPSFLSSIFGGKGNPQPPPSSRRSHSTSRVGVASSASAREHCLRFFLSVDFGGHNNTADLVRQSGQVSLPQHEVEQVKKLQRRSLTRAISHEGKARIGVSGPTMTAGTSTFAGSHAAPRLDTNRATSRSRNRSDPFNGRDKGSSTVWLRISDPRALEAVQRAIDQKHIPRSGTNTPAFEKADPFAKRLDKGGKGDSAISRTEYVDSPVQAMKDLESGVEDIQIVETTEPPMRAEAKEVQEVERERGRPARGRNSPNSPKSERTDRMDSPRSDTSSAELRTPKVDTGDSVLVVEVDDQETGNKQNRNKWLRGVWREESMERSSGYRAQSASPGRLKSGMLLNN